MQTPDGTCPKLTINRRGPFREGEYAQLLDRRGRSYLVHLTERNLFESHIGNYPARELIGQPEGSWIVTNKGHRLLAVRPTLADLTLRMPRLATVMYPKDLGRCSFTPICFQARECWRPERGPARSRWRC